MTEVRAKVRGLYTSPAASVSAAEGGLRVATNVVFERKDTASPRPGFRLASYTSSARTMQRILPWPASPDAVRLNTDGTCAWLSAPTSYITSNGSADVAWFGDAFACAATARKNLYVGGAYGGIRKLTSNSDVIASVSGVEPPFIFTVAGDTTATWLANNYYCAYRVLLRRKDANELTVRSAAIGRVRYRNLSGASASTYVTVGLPLDAAAGDVVEIYRTRTSTVDPPDQFFLQSEKTLTSTNISNGYVAEYDTVEDQYLGAACYTNYSREGIEGSNFRAPVVGAIETFQGSLFGGLIVTPARIQLSRNDGGDCSGASAGIGYRTINGTRTNGSAVIAMASTTGLQVGMFADASAGWSANPPRITSIVGLNVTVNATWTGATDGAPAARTFYDTIRIGNDYYVAHTLAYFMAAMRGLITLTNATPNPDYYVYALGQYARYNSGGLLLSQKNVRFVIEEREAVAEENSVYATHGDEYSPALPLPSAAADPDRQVANETVYNRIVYSKKDEPEHFPLPYYESVGSSTGVIYALKATRDALWIFKTDGVWRLSGSAAPNWRIDPVDNTLCILHPNTVTRLGESIFVLTTRGVFEVSDQRVASISTQIDDQLEPFIREMANAGTSVTSYAGHWMAADPTSGNVLLGIGSAYNTDSAARIFCYSTATGEWSEWNMPFAYQSEA